MISSKHAKTRILHLSTDAVRKLVRERLLGEDMTPVCSAYAAEPSEDLVIALLKCTDLPQESRSAVISACVEVYRRTVVWVATPESCDPLIDWNTTIVRLCRVVDVTSPHELFHLALLFLETVLDTLDINSRVRTAAVRAFMGFPQTAEHVVIWERVFGNSDSAAYASKVLSRISAFKGRNT